MKHHINVVRYPGGKQRLINFIIDFIPKQFYKSGMYTEPFVGGATVFFTLNPKKALLSDINSELIDLYRGLKKDPIKIWRLYRSFPSTKKAYYKIRDSADTLDLIERAARILYLNRTCFKGMWRHNSQGKFNIGYGGQDRRWVISKEILIAASNRLRRAFLKNVDFEKTIDECSKGDFIFLDPPYKPGRKELTNSHYTYNKFTFDDCKRLARSLRRASKMGVKWLLITSSHIDNVRLFKGNKIFKLPRGTGNKPGLLTSNSEEVLIYNYAL